MNGCVYVCLRIRNYKNEQKFEIKRIVQFTVWQMTREANKIYIK